MTHFTRKILAGIAILIFLGSSCSSHPPAVNSETEPEDTPNSVVITHQTQADFQQGTSSDALDLNIAPGSINLAETLQTSTLSTTEQFERGRSTHGAVSTENNEISLQRNYAFTQLYESDIFGQWATTIFDATHRYLTVASGSSVIVIDNQNTEDPADDTIVNRYTATTTPAIQHVTEIYSLEKTSSGVLFIATAEGLDVIDTKNTITQSDDEYKFSYSTTSTPALLDNDPLIDYDETNHMLYAGSMANGVRVINTNGTPGDITDDTAAFTYNTASTPALPSNRILHVHYDSGNHLLYVGTTVGMTVINTQGTSNFGDDTVMFTYSTTSSPALSSNYPYGSFFDADTGLVYLYGSGNGLDVIDTNGTPYTAADDTVINYSMTSTPALFSSGVAAVSPDASAQRLYIFDMNGITVLNTQGTFSQADDTVVASYSFFNDPGFPVASITGGFYAPEHDAIYYTSEWGVGMIQQSYPTTEEYISEPIDLRDVAARVVSWTGDFPAGTSVAFQTRTGGEDSYWIDEFDDGMTANVINIWGGDFNTIEESNGILTLSNPADTTWAAFKIDTGKAEDFYPVGSILRMRLKVSFSGTNYIDWLFSDEWESYPTKFSIPNRWISVMNVATAPFSSLGVEPIWDTGTWQATDTYQVDSVSVESPTGWSDWSESLTQQYGSVIPSSLTQTYLQLKAILSTADPSVTPRLKSITIASGYQPSGVYTSPIMDSGSTDTTWDLISWEGTFPEQTSVAVKVRSGNNADLSDAVAWESLDQTIENAITPLSSLPGVANGTRYFQYHITLSTADSTKTPTIDSVSVQYTN